MSAIITGRTHTGTVVHLAVKVKHVDPKFTQLMLAQACGMSRRAVLYLGECPEGTPVTCKRCLATMNKNAVETTKPEEDMTTVVAKGANRPAAAKRTAKAAQRTPLPPKPGQVQGAKDAIAATQVDKRKNPALVKKIQDKTIADIKAGKLVAPGTKPKPPVGATPHDKAAKLVEEAKAAGWAAAAEVGELPGDLVTFHAVRGNPVSETLTLHWITGGTRPGTYTNGGREVQAMNAATVRRILATPAEAAAKVRAAYASGKGKAKRAAVKVATAAPLPFNIQESTYEEILRMVQGKTVTWTNSISGLNESAVVGGSGKNAPKITGEEGKRALVFPAKGEGFRTVRLSSIVSVS